MKNPPGKPQLVENPCHPDNEFLADKVNTYGTVSTVGFVVGGAALGAGLLWLLLQPSGETEEAVASQPQLELQVGAGAVGVRGTF